ncbi:MAG: hypothetical protein EP338_08320 [Bacteroidetes bacterium]|nr:MAG: hypothetical protein EP338_08320 [Bacteroidota bacterium]
MGIWRKITNGFRNKDKYHNKRTFKEFARLYDMKRALEVKSILEEHDIPVYMLDLRNVGSEKKSYIAIRVPGKFYDQAKEIVDPNEESAN